MTNRQTFKAAALNRVAPFLKDESGVMAPLMLIFFFFMLVIGGIAVDVMRFESRRVALQQTLDRATLAAASLENKMDATAVVKSYFNSAGVKGDLDDADIKVISGMNSKTVQVKAKVKSNNYFMSMVNVPYLQANNLSEAQQRVNDIDIILVLDVSGSMAGTKITSLKDAARNFVDQVKAKDDENRISIGVVPYNAQVNLGAPLRGFYNATNLHGVPNSNCLELPSSVFGSVALSRTVPLPMMAHADTEGTVSGTAYVTPASGAPGNSAARRWCNAGTNNAVTLPSKDPTKIKNAISALTAEGNTSILLGMRWATALIDPSARSIYTDLIADKKMDASMAGRPLNYSTAENPSMKVIVLMTDGEHVAHNRVTDPYKTGIANNLVAPAGNTAQIWRATTGDTNFSVFHSSKVNTKNATTIADSKPYYVPHLNAWHVRPWNGSAAPKTTDKYSPTTTTYSNSKLMTWQEVWAAVSVDYVGRQFFQRPLGSTAYSDAMGKLEAQYASVAEMNTRLAENCTAAKADGKNILVFGIAFQAPAAGKAAIQSCTSTPTSTYYYDVTQTDKIKEAFEVIATNLSQLRLTQ